MAFLLRGDLGAQQVDIPNFGILSNTGGYIEGEMLLTSGSEIYICGQKEPAQFGWNLRFRGAGDIRYRPQASGGLSQSGVLPVDEFFTFRFEHDGVNTKLAVNGVEVWSIPETLASNSQDALFRFQLNAVSELKWLKCSDGATVRDYNKQALSGANDTVFPDIEGNNDGTLVNFPTDDSQWIFYDDGGGAVEQPVVSVNAEEVHQANTLSISAFNSVSSVIAEQVENANLIDVFLSQLTSNIQAQEAHDATALSIEQSASQAVNSISAEQVEQANLIGISQSLPVNSVQAQENQQANTLTIEQSAGQSISLNTAQQVEQGTVLSLAQQQALAHIVAEQLSDASFADVSNLQAVTMIIAEETHHANTLNVEQYTGQFVTLITAEQKSESQTLLISEVSAIDVLQAEQVTNAETMAFNQVQRLTQITAEQLTEAQLLTILTSGDNTDLSGLRLIPVTSKYTINPTNTTRYSLQKV